MSVQAVEVCPLSGKGCKGCQSGGYCATFFSHDIIDFVIDVVSCSIFAFLGAGPILLLLPCSGMGAGALLPLAPCSSSTISAAASEHPIVVREVDGKGLGMAINQTQTQKQQVPSS